MNEQKVLPKTKKQKGNEGENKAAQYLVENGFEIVARNWRTRSGEIDIVAHKDDTLVFVEVKRLLNGDERVLAHVVGSQKQQRIIKTSKCFLVNNRKYNNDFIRYDVIVVDMPGVLPIYHIENAFSESL